MASEKSFEQNLKALEKIVGKLESGTPSLEESIKLFEKGRELGKSCEERLQQAELKILELVEDDKGQLGTAELPTPEEE